MRATAVIGACFGDEGKGLITDMLAQARPDAVVVRFNGGAQAGHTVQRPDGTRHVFHHFGSGTLAGRRTYLSRYFISNPILWAREWAELDRPEPLYVDQDSPVTTPYDMTFNQELERKRGDVRHGSCGVGIDETMQRGLAAVPLTVRDLANRDALIEKLHMVRGWARMRRETHDLPAGEFLKDDEVIRRFADVCRNYHANNVACDKGVLDGKDIVFEGAQGLLLDQDNDFFPHVTHSKTGLVNVVNLCPRTHDLDVVYVTRAYMTRHGAGPFPSEDQNMTFPDATNVHHDFQGHLRFGALDLDLIKDTVTDDMASVGWVVQEASFAVTCFDQVPDLIQAVHRKVRTTIPKDQLDAYLGRVRFVGRGPCREDVSG